MLRILLLTLVVVVAMPAQTAIQGSGDEIEWSRIRTTKSEEELLAYIEKYPNSRYADFASRRIDELAWERVDKTNPAAVKDFLRRYPDLRINLPPSMQAAESEQPESARQPNERTAAAGHESGVSKALRLLALAYESRRIEQIRTVWPGISQDTAKKVQQTFKEASSISMKLEPTAPAVIEGSTAIVVCRRTLDMVDNGRPNLTAALVSIKLRLIGQEWLIESVQ